eukprot:COSAG01_NODE_4805_length_4730_cov_579.199482_6_plen_174_part_00
MGSTRTGTVRYGLPGLVPVPNPRTAAGDLGGLCYPLLYGCTRTSTRSGTLNSPVATSVLYVLLDSSYEYSAFLTESDRSLQKNCSECVTAPPRNFRSLRSRIPAGRASHAWLSHAPRATTEANTLRCTTEVPVLVNYLSFYPPTIPWVPGNKVTSNQVRLEVESECCRIHGYI